MRARLNSNRFATKNLNLIHFVIEKLQRLMYNGKDKTKMLKRRDYVE